MEGVRSSQETQLRHHRSEPTWVDSESCFPRFCALTCGAIREVLGVISKPKRASEKDEKALCAVKHRWGDSRRVGLVGKWVLGAYFLVGRGFPSNSSQRRVVGRKRNLPGFNPTVAHPHNTSHR